MFVFFFFKQKTAYEMRISDWSSDVCSSDLGLAGMPRRIPDYPQAFASWNMVISVGAVLTSLSILFFIYIIYHTLRFGKSAGINPWGEFATTLEWKIGRASCRERVCQYV